MSKIGEEKKIPPEAKKYLDQISMTIYQELRQLAMQSGFELEIDGEMPLNVWLRKEMKRKNISLIKLSNKANIPKSTLHGWMWGRVDLYYIRIKNLLKVMSDLS
jgi:hypothetical protein